MGATLRQMVGSGTMAGRGGMTTAELIRGMTTTGEGVGEAQVQGMTKAERETVHMIQGIVITDDNSNELKVLEVQHQQPLSICIQLEVVLKVIKRLDHLKISNE